MSFEIRRGIVTLTAVAAVAGHAIKPDLALADNHAEKPAPARVEKDIAVDTNAESQADIVIGQIGGEVLRLYNQERHDPRADRVARAYGDASPSGSRDIKTIELVVNNHDSKVKGYNGKYRFFATGRAGGDHKLQAEEIDSVRIREGEHKASSTYGHASLADLEIVRNVEHGTTVTWLREDSYLTRGKNLTRVFNTTDGGHHNSERLNTNMVNATAGRMRRVLHAAKNGIPTDLLARLPQKRSGGVALTPPESPTIKPPTTSPAFTPLLNLHPERLGTMPAEVKQDVAGHALWVPSEGCSAYEVQTGDGRGVGAILAKHCGFLSVNGRIAKDANGNMIFRTGFPIITAKGEIFIPGGMQVAGTLDQFYADPTDTNDMVIGKYANSRLDIDQVVSLARQEVKLPADTAALPQATLGFMRGYPAVVAHPQNSEGALEAQDFVMALLGQNATSLTDNNGQVVEHLRVTQFAAIPNEDGTLPNPGVSGAGTQEDPAAHEGTDDVIGVVSGGVDFNQRPEQRRYYQDFYKADLSPPFGEVESINGDMPTTESGSNVIAAEVIPVLPNLSAEAQLSLFESRANFMSATFQRKVIKNGLAYIKSGDGSGFWMEQASIYVDTVTNSAFAIGYNPGSSNGTYTFFIPNARIDLPRVIDLYSADNQTAPSLTKLPGAIQPAAQGANSFKIEGSPLDVGRMVFASQPTPTSPAASLSISDQNELEINLPADGSVPVADHNPNNP